MSSTLISLIVTFVFVILLVIGFFVGFGRGVKRSTANLIFALIGAVVAFFITPTITRAIVGIDVNYNGESVLLGELAIAIAKGNPDLANMIDANENVKALFANLPQAILNTVVFILLVMAAELVMYIIYKIIAAIFLKKKKGVSKHRLSGGFVGLIKTFVIVVFAFMPFASLIGLANSIIETPSYIIGGQAAETAVYAAEPEVPSEGEETPGESETPDTSETPEDSNKGLIGEYVPDTVVMVVQGFESSFLTKICGVFNMDNDLFDYISAFEIAGEKVVIREEITNYYTVAELAYQIINMQDIKYSELNYAQLEDSFNRVADGGLYRTVVSEAIAEVIVNYNDYSFVQNIPAVEDYSEILDTLGEKLAIAQGDKKLAAYFTNDLKQIFKTIKVLGENGIIDEIAKLEEKTTANVLDVLTSDKNTSKFQDAISNVFKINLVRDGIVPIADLTLEKVTTEFDKIGVDTSDWTDDKWNQLSVSLVNVVDKYNSLTKTVDLFDVIADPTILLDKEQNYNIDEIMSTLGSLVDDLRGVELLKTSENKPIVDKLLTTNNIVLPADDEKIYKADGTLAEIKNYKQLMTFVSPSLTKMRDSGLYDIVKTSEDSTKTMIDLAVLLSKKGNATLLSDVLLPLQQVEPTKTLIINELAKTLNNSIINLSGLNEYSEWSNDLDYISDLLITLNNNTVKVNEEDKTYLEIVLKDNVNDLLKNIDATKVESVIKPILYAKSTENLKVELINTIKSVLDGFTSPAMSAIDITKVTLNESEKENQGEEICKVFANFIEINKVYTDGMKLKDVDKTLLGKLLSSMQANAYRVEKSTDSENEKTEVGLFNGAYINLVDKFNKEFSDAMPAIEAEMGEGYMAETNYANIDFVKICEIIAKLESTEDNN